MRRLALGARQQSLDLDGFSRYASKERVREKGWLGVSSQMGIGVVSSLVARWYESEQTS